MLETELGLMNKLAQISKISASTNTQHGKKHTLKWILIPPPHHPIVFGQLD